MDPLNVDHFSCTPLVRELISLRNNEVTPSLCDHDISIISVTSSPLIPSLPFFVHLFSIQMWACALGHLEAAVVLYKWDRRALAIPDSLGRLPLSIARSRGHTKLAECLEQLQREEQQPPAPLPPTTRMSFSPAPDAPTTDSWMVNWANDSVVAPSGKKGGPATTTTTSNTTSLNPGQ